ncbi:hypothetical protein CBOM_01131 [Ceraceosorus bombacis]|uniref:Mmc1 C-terminal domain-containing protein n=1 Tax=Ceraceosorus bombacis TaxID=401625 RepID=A0A0P1BBN8_9BASI|nr:hypothetical protein CBOM_01131 [Ceraceosorus bombacis]
MWAERLGRAAERLERHSTALTRHEAATEERNVRTALVAPNSDASSRLLQALLDDPLAFASSNSSSSASSTIDLASTPKTLSLEVDPHAHTLIRASDSGLPASRVSKDAIEIDLPWLREAQLEILQVAESADSTSCLDALYECDMHIFLLSAQDILLLRRTGRLAKERGASERIERVRRQLDLLAIFLDWPGTVLVVDHGDATLDEAAKERVLDTLEEVISANVGRFDEKSQNDASVEAAAGQRGLQHFVLHVSTTAALLANGHLRVGLGLPLVGLQGKSSTTGDSTLTSTSKPDAAHAWELFAQLSASSGLSELRAHFLHAPLLSPTSAERSFTRSRRAASVAYQSSARLLRHALEEARARLIIAQEDVRRAQGLRDVLRQGIQHDLNSLALRVLSKGHLNSTNPLQSPRSDVDSSAKNNKLHIRAGDRSRSALGSASDSASLLEKTFSQRLPWWKLLWKVDDVRAEVDNAVRSSFSKDLEDRLIFEAGRTLSFAEDQMKVTEAALGTLTARPRSENAGRAELSSSSVGGATSWQGHVESSQRSYFDSPLLRNQVAQQSKLHRAARSYSSNLLQPRSFAWPITSRRSQIFSQGGPLEVLVSRAQALVMRFYLSSSTVASASLISAQLPAVSPWLSTNTFLGEDACKTLLPLAMQSSTAAGLSLLATLAFAFHLQGAWTKAKRRFWTDWDRLAQGLEADLEVS